MNIEFVADNFVCCSSTGLGLPLSIRELDVVIAVAKGEETGEGTEDAYGCGSRG